MVVIYNKEDSNIININLELFLLQFVLFSFYFDFLFKIRIVFIL